MFEFSEIEMLELDLMGIEPHQVEQQFLILLKEDEEIVISATKRLKKRFVAKAVLNIAPALVAVGAMLGVVTAVVTNSSEEKEEGDLITVVASADQCYAWVDQKDYQYFDKYCK